jgi:hypothetical protein
MDGPQKFTTESREGNIAIRFRGRRTPFRLPWISYASLLINACREIVSQLKGLEITTCLDLDTFDAKKRALEALHYKIAND